MIRAAHQKDLKAVLALWRVCFPGDETFAPWFFKTHFTLSALLLDETAGRIAAMLQRLPCKICSCGESFEASYLYGIATHPDFRGGGRMARLMEAAFQLDAAESRPVSVLIPQTAALFSLYARFGYAKAFFVDDTVVTRPQTQPSPDSAFRRLTVSDIPALDALYRASTAEFPLFLSRTSDDWAAQIELFDALGAGVYGTFRAERLLAAGFLWPDGQVQEVLAETIPARTAWADQLLAARPEIPTLRLTFPGEARPFGCIRFHDGRTVSGKGYLNLMFN